MRVEIEIPGADDQGRVFLTWTPVQATARLVDGEGAPVEATLRNAGAGGQLRFATARTHEGSASLPLTLPASGEPVPFFVAGEFGRPSLAYGDARLEAAADGQAAPLGSRDLMVRVRKNAETLQPAERDRFLAAFGTLNGQGTGRFGAFRSMHVDGPASREAHGNSGFLPWHRAYLLDLERELQLIDPSVALPYWRFDQPAPKLFSRDYIGVPGDADMLEFSAGHPFLTWTTDNQLGITRGMFFGIGDAAFVISEEDTLALGDRYGAFQDMEGDPHGNAHTSFSGSISGIPTAARDPLFFMLHANVDRLWAKWQWLFHRTSPADANAYAAPNPNRIGHRLDDSMWPWNGVTGPPRPPDAPGGEMASSPSTSAPGGKPLVRSMIDYQAVGGGAHLGFAYDDVPFELPAGDV